MSDIDIRKAAPALLDRAEQWLESERRIAGHTGNATAQLITALAEALRAEMKGWANARGDAVDYSLRADELEAIVRELAFLEPIVRDADALYPRQVCGLCDGEDGVKGTVDHADGCLWLRAKTWNEAHPAEVSQ